ncbi:unnamed protein product [Dicrocoelium dendriticum]|nr:unnamed protein product [Dicrocoelium dendriticum]
MWKQGKITPLFKTDNRSEPAKYCTVDLLPILSKVIEASTAEALVAHLICTNLTAPEQHGSHKRRSCTTNLLISRSSWTETADEDRGTDVIYLDLSKDFSIDWTAHSALKARKLGSW